MPADFPDMKSLKELGKTLGVEYRGQSEEEYRTLLAKKLVKDYGDTVAAAEVLTGKGWNKWNEDEKQFAMKLQTTYTSGGNVDEIIEGFYAKKEEQTSEERLGYDRIEITSKGITFKGVKRKGKKENITFGLHGLEIEEIEEREIAPGVKIPLVMYGPHYSYTPIFSQRNI